MDKVDCRFTKGCTPCGYTCELEANGNGIFAFMFLEVIENINNIHRKVC